MFRQEEAGQQHVDAHQAFARQGDAIGARLGQVAVVAQGVDRAGKARQHVDAVFLREVRRAGSSRASTAARTRESAALRRSGDTRGRAESRRSRSPPDTPATCRGSARARR